MPQEAVVAEVECKLFEEGRVLILAELLNVPIHGLRVIERCQVFIADNIIVRQHNRRRNV